MVYDFYSPEMLETFNAIVACENEIITPDIKQWRDRYMSCCDKQNREKIALKKQDVVELYPRVLKLAEDYALQNKWQGYESPELYKTDEDRRIYIKELFARYNASTKDFFKYTRDNLGVFYTDALHLRIFIDILKNKAKLPNSDVKTGSPIFSKLETVYYVTRCMELVGDGKTTGELPAIVRQIKKYDINGERQEGISPLYKPCSKMYV